MTEVWESFSHLSENVFFNLGLLLIVGMIGGNITERFHLPRVTGYIIVGMIFGPHGLGFLGKEFVYDIKIVKVLALGFIGFNIGMELKRQVLKMEALEVIFMTFFQALFTFAVVFVVVYFVAKEHKVTYALLLGSIATVTTPAPIVACMRGYKTHGEISELVCPMVAIDDLIGIVIFSLVLPFSVYFAGHEGEAITFGKFILGPIFNIGFSMLIGIALGYATLLVLRVYKDADNISIVLIIATAVLVGVGIGETFETSDILLPLMMGLVITNGIKSRMTERIKGNTDAIVLPLLLVFFTISGADLKLDKFALIGLLGVVYIFVRIFGKVIGTRIAATLMKEDNIVKNYLGVTLIPQGGVALDMAILAEVRFLQIYTETGNSVFEEIGTTVFTVILGAIIFYKVIGEVVVKWAFSKSGEIDEDENHHIKHVW